ncbi:MAG: hypothetical protein OQK12_01795, partial [Motiliproteus sp.]|nr:hypothetical protein [Motiliproteus sp.]
MPTSKLKQNSDSKLRLASRSIKGFLLRVSILFSALGFLLIYLAANSAYRDSVRNSTIESSQQIAQTTFDSIYRLKQKGWNIDEVNAFIAEQQQRNPS